MFAISAHRGGRRGWTVKWARNWRIWKWYADYFPIKIVSSLFNVLLMDSDDIFVAKSKPTFIIVCLRVTSATMVIKSRGCSKQLPWVPLRHLLLSTALTTGEDCRSGSIAQLLTRLPPPWCSLLRGCVRLCHRGYLYSQNYSKDHVTSGLL